jgi:hypothetical protein
MNGAGATPFRSFGFSADTIRVTELERELQVAAHQLQVAKDKLRIAEHETQQEARTDITLFRPCFR